MICKYCGARIDPESEVCPKCGKRGNKKEGGNGFWDIARGPASDLKTEAVVVNEPKSIKSYIPIAICGLICLLCFIITIVGVVSSNSRIKAIKKTYDTQLAEQTRQFTEQNENLQRQIDQLSDQYTNFSSQPVRVEESLRILSSPTPETREIGFQSTPGFYLFGLRVEGQVVSFRWEKQQQNGDWVTITFDDRSINWELGLRLEESLTDGTTKLVAIGLTPLSFGTYKCTVIGINGAVQSTTVDLINSAEDEGEISDTPSYTDVPASPSPTDVGSISDPDEDGSEAADSNNGEKEGGWW